MPRYLGQHFLENKKKLQEIINALEFPPKADQPRAEKNGDVVIEIGPGHGELTGELVNWSISKNIKIKIIAIEKDKKFADDLKEKFENNKNIEIIEGDALKIIPSIPKIHNLKPNTYKIVGNIPYYITGYLFRILGELENKPELIVLLIQKEVAERVCLPRRSISGGGRSKIKMNLLAASVQFWAEPKIISYVSKNDFSPPPKVESAIIKLIPFNTIACDSIEKEKYYRFIKILFKQPRKTILNNLRQTTNDQRLLTEKLKSIGVNPQNRPQDLSVDGIKKMVNLFYNYNNEY